MTTYATVCSGIEAPSAAWEPLGWEPLWFSEIEPFPCAVLAARLSEVPNIGDMTTAASRIRAAEFPAPDIFCGGTPCQAFSVAGLRGGLGDERGKLTLEYVRICDAIDAGRTNPAVHLWENVPGVLSSKDNAFGYLLAGLAGESEPLVASGGKWTNAGWVVGPQRTVAWRVLDAQYFGVAQRRRRLFVVASAGDTDPRKILFEREGLRRDTPPSREAREDVAKCITAGVGSRYDYETETLPINTLTLGERPDPANDARMTFGVGNDGDPQFTLQANHSHAVAFGGDIARNLAARYDSSPCSDRGMDVVSRCGVVRRLTPRECERLQGFPDDWTKITYRGKPAADGPRYKALGNSMAVPVIRWIGDRISRVLSGTFAE